ncbi:hypothetical protein EV175_001985 [Coemansia sp. RSA 1933]|nr:hypothetical protein EV175_001985 [Coemansia sp. RSA 1933]
MGVVESLPSSTGMHEYQHSNRRFIFGARRRSVCAGSSDSNGADVPPKPLKCATVFLSDGHDGILFSPGISDGAGEPHRARTRSRLRESLKRHSLWQVSAPTAWPATGAAAEVPFLEGDCRDGGASEKVRAMSPPPLLQRSLLSASMPNLPTRQQNDQGCCDDESDSSSEDNNKPCSVASSSNDSETGDSPVDRPKSRRRLDPRIIGRYLHKMAPSTMPQQQKSHEEAADIEPQQQHDFPQDIVPGYGDGLVQLNTDFEKLGVCYDDLVSTKDLFAGGSTNGSAPSSSSSWLSSMSCHEREDETDPPALPATLCSTDSPGALASSMSSSLTLSEIGLDSAKDDGMQGVADDILDYDEYIYLSASCGADKENSGVPEQPSEQPPETTVRRWWPRRVLPVRNMQYMPKLSKVFSDCRLQGLYNDSGFVCTHCLHSSSSDGGEQQQQQQQQPPPVDEAMMLMDSTDSPLPSASYCSDSRCRRHHTRTSSVMRWLATGYPVKPVCRDQEQPDGFRMDYWDLLSRFPMRPTSSLALSSLREMAVSESEDSSHQQQLKRPGRSCVGLPGSTSSYVGALGDSDDDSTSDTDECTSSSRALGNGLQQQRAKQKQRRVLSEPMQYILYNSYLRYYGKPGEQAAS